MQPTFSPTYKQEFHFAENTDSKGCFCCWSSKTRKPKEYIIDGQNRFIPTKKATHQQRMDANQRLGNLLREKFTPDPIENDRAFEMLKTRVNDTLNNGDPITDERLQIIIKEMYLLKKDLYEGLKHVD